VDWRCYSPATMADGGLLSLQDAYGEIEEQFNAALELTLDPRGPEMLYDIVGGLGLEAGRSVVDAGCGEGRHSIELARRFGLQVLGVDALQRHVDISEAGLAKAISAEPALDGLVRFAVGYVEDLPVEAASVDLVWCRDVLSMIEDQHATYAEFRRVLKPGGWAVVYQMFATELLEPREAAWLLPTMGCFAASMDPAHSEAAIAAAGLTVESCLVLGPEWGEFDQERTGKPGRKLLHAGRLLRDRNRYIEQFGQENYDIALGDCLWHVYRLVGKLSGRIYVLSARG
jgi:ubiquinone/menaquinone biosynthesis C-methylase UbiE